MSTLLEQLAVPAKRGSVVAACARLIDDEVAKKTGLMALPLKAAFKTVKAIRPGFIPGAVDFLLDEFCQALEPFYQAWVARPPAERGPLSDALARQADPVANALLGVTDRRAERSTHRTVKALYAQLRGAARGHVIAALPGLGRAMEPHLACEDRAA